MGRHGKEILVTTDLSVLSLTEFTYLCCGLRHGIKEESRRLLI